MARKCGLKDADNGRVNNLFPTCAHPQRFGGRLSHCSALRKSFKPHHSDCQPHLPLAQCGLKTDLDPHQNRSFGFCSASPKSAVSVLKLTQVLDILFCSCGFHLVSSFFLACFQRLQIVDTSTHDVALVLI